MYKAGPILWLIAEEEIGVKEIRSVFQEVAPVGKRCCDWVQFKVDKRRLEFCGPFISVDDPGRQHSIEMVVDRSRSRARASLSRRGRPMGLSLVLGG